MDTPADAAKRTIIALLKRRRTPADNAALARLQRAFPVQAKAALELLQAEAPSEPETPSRLTVDRERVTLTAAEHGLVRALAGVTFGNAWSARRFVRALYDVIRREGDAATTTEGGRRWLRDLGHRYRRQIGKCLVTDCARCAGKVA